MKLSKLRKSLEKNKIFFELIVASLLSFMAIYVSIQANKIAETQTSIMEQENLPQLEIRMTQDYNQDLKIYDNNNWLFFNRGGKLLNFDTREYTFFKFTHVHKMEVDSLSLPIYAYFNMRGILSGESDGLIYQIDNNHNGFKEIELRNKLSEYGFFDIESYLQISYEDIFDNKHLEYYKISPGISKISEKKWKEMSALFIESKEKFTFPKLQTSEILNKLKKSNSP